MPTDISKIISYAAYQAYERRLLHQVRQAAIPHHVAIIMDGNRRFAREIGLGNVLDGHVKGRDKLEEVLEWCLEVGVRILTVYAFSTENLARPSTEVQHLMHLFAENFRKVGDDERVHKHKIRIHVFGDRSLLPTEVIESIEYAEDRTEDPFVAGAMDRARQVEIHRNRDGAAAREIERGHRHQLAIGHGYSDVCPIRKDALDGVDGDPELRVLPGRRAVEGQELRHIPKADEVDLRRP